MILTAGLIEASRLQFALTAMFHWIFVPLTLGLGFILAFMETKYYISGDEFWKKTTKFWGRIFAINFAIGVATGIILEFEFGTNWSNYSWFVGDIFGAPLAIEGILAFFMESTFFAVMYFGWDKVSKKFHLWSTWLTAIGANLSAWWILVANAWMQHPVGMEFNPETARNEMMNFWEVALSPVAIHKFFHAVTNGFVLASVVVIGISAWYLLKKRDQMYAIKSMKIAGVFGLLSCIAVLYTGDGSAVLVAKHQPMKLAAMEAMYEGKEDAPLTAFGIVNPNKRYNNDDKEFLFKIDIPYGLSLLAERKAHSFVPGINDLIYGKEYINAKGEKVTFLPYQEMVNRGNAAVNALKEFQEAKAVGNVAKMDSTRQTIKENFEYFGYAYIPDPQQSIPPIGLTFYAFRIMVYIGCLLFLLFILTLVLLHKQKKGGYNIENSKWFLYLAILCVPLVYICSQCGWIVSEVGRQPWAIQGLLPVNASASGVSTGNVITTIIIFFVLFTVLLIAELKIMFNQIKKGPEGINY